MKYIVLILFITGVFNSQTYMSKYKLNYFENISITDTVELNKNELPFNLEIEYTIFSSKKYMYIIAKTKNIISPLETLGNDVEIIKVDNNKKIIFNQTTNKYYNLTVSNRTDFKEVIYDKQLSKLVNPLVFIKNNELGIKEIRTNKLSVRLLESIEVDLNLNFKKEFKKINKEDVKDNLVLY